MGRGESGMVATTTDVIKCGGRRTTEQFSHDKLHSSVRAACLSVRSPEGEAETVAEHVVTSVASWCHEKSAVTSEDIRRIAAGTLQLFHPEAAYLYQNHQLVI